MGCDGEAIAQAPKPERLRTATALGRWAQPLLVLGLRAAPRPPLLPAPADARRHCASAAPGATFSAAAAAAGGKIKVDKPVVTQNGDEMTR